MTISKISTYVSHKKEQCDYLTVSGNVTKIKAKLINRTQNSNFKLRSKKQKYKIPIMDKLKTNRVLFKQIQCKKRLFITQKRYFIFCNFP